ncbi:hydrolase [Pseudoclavibacter endophyticus]|uniref:Zinc-dependent metalloprotease n=1 Tax=Pseudoclavibacter endophyticus TaxID=1778590 RepID=A0A6H9WUD1_9MICO|nr:zinc-dependent metalloprotease [Pseudoclavibacter endophyticus]KAB1649790.1 zinc-dependent metalloprotease [Pseudoclavibacter endophyticus]GGA59735.1 hydrolase [Pseudoclavibacter endophyticus]
MADRDGANADHEDDRDPQDELREMLRDMLEGGSGFDPSKLAGIGGLPNDPAAVQALMNNMQAALAKQTDGIDWETATEHAKRVARPENREVSPEEAERFQQAFRLAGLWLGEATELGEVAELPQTLTRLEWIGGSMGLWSQLAEPVATSIADALMEVLKDQTPPDMQGMVQQSGAMMRNLGGAMFSVQLGQVIGQLSAEVMAGGDIGMPVFDRPRAALLPQNVATFAEGLDVTASEVELYLAVRELAHARLFSHAKWLQTHLVSSVTAFARGITIDVERIEGLVRDLDPTDSDAIREALSSGAFIPPRTTEQEATLARLETMLALIEGWVDVVTQDATARLPKAEAIAEMVRRRRATGGPAERAFSTLVGLELRPRRLRDASAMWRAVADAHGSAARDALWDHFDALPTSADLDEPTLLVTRLDVGETAGDDFDRELESLLNDPSAFGGAPAGGMGTTHDENEDAVGRPGGAGDTDGTDDGTDGDGNTPGDGRTDGESGTDGDRPETGDAPDAPTGDR